MKSKLWGLLPFLLLFMATGAQAEFFQQPLLSPLELHRLQEQHPEGITVVDIRPLEHKVPEASYTAGHIPESVSSPYATWRGQPENPGKMVTVDKLTWLVQALGVEQDTPVVVVHRGDSPSDFGAAARVYWSLKTAGLRELAILDGGFQAWQQAGLPISTEAHTALPSDYEVQLKTAWLATTADIEQLLSRSEVQLLDARPEAFFWGEKWHGAAARPGTIAGAEFFDNHRWFQPESPLLEPPERLRNLVQEHQLGHSEVTVSFCNTGHWAATNWFVLSELLGVEGVKLYPESLVEWSSAGLPMDHVPGSLRWAWISTRQWLNAQFN